MATTTIPNVAIMRVGTWNASTGKTQITRDDIASMVDAYNDHLVDRAPIKIGHNDQRFQDADGNPPGDGDPAYDWVENLRVSDDGETLLADFAGIPAKLGEIMKSAWRRRSAEIRWKVQNAAGKTYQAVLTGLAVLGVTPPAVKGLADIEALYSDASHSTVFFEDDTPGIPHTNVETEEPEQQETPSGENQQTMGGTAVADPKNVREALGLAADATDEQVREAFGSAFPAAEPAPEPEPLPTAASEETKPEGPKLVQVDAAVFADLQEKAAAQETRLAAFEADRTKERHDKIISDAMAAGKIHPKSEANFRALLGSDEQGTVALIADLPEVVPTREVGHADFAAHTDDDDNLVAAMSRSLGLEF